MAALRFRACRRGFPLANLCERAGRKNSLADISRSFAVVKVKSKHDNVNFKEHQKWGRRQQRRKRRS